MTREQIEQALTDAKIDEAYEAMKTVLRPLGRLLGRRDDTKPPSDVDAIVANARQAARAVLVSALQAVETPTPTWQPMSSAPKDGTQVLIFVPGRYQGAGGISWACYVHGEWLDAMAMRLGPSDISHWMPLPLPPAPAPAPPEGRTP